MEPIITQLIIILKQALIVNVAVPLRGTLFMDFNSKR
jgi:hypothetical protein